MNLSSLLESTAHQFPDSVAVVSGQTRLSYEALDHRANQVANLLTELGINARDKVALSCPNVPEFPIIYFGILKTGATVVPLNVLLKSHEVAYHLQDSDAAAYFCFTGTTDLPVGTEGLAGFRLANEADGSCRHFIAIDSEISTPRTDDSTGTQVLTLSNSILGQDREFATRAVHEGDTAVILYTSGTTGRPKGAELTHQNMRANALACQQLFDIDSARPDTYLCTLPLFHSFGQTVVQNAGIAFGGCLVMMPRFDARRALEVMRTDSVTFFAGVPTMYWGLLRTLDEYPGSPVEATDIAQSLRVAVSGGAALPKELHRTFERRFGIRISEGYGLSETSPVASFTPYGQPPRVGSIGKPIPGVTMKLIDPTPGRWDEIEWGPEVVGEIAIKGHNVMAGYYKRPEATAEAMVDGWFRSGDLARRDADGWYYIVDRSKDMIIRGGYNVYPREVEEVLVTHPRISLAAVIGVAHPSHGEEIKAYVILTEGDSIAADEIVAWSKAQLASYKYPRTVEIVDSLPMTATGKILKRELGQ